MNLTIIQSRIYHVRDHRVMLHADLAVLYQIETKRLKESVRRNKKRFPADFMFELTKDEFESISNGKNLRTQNANSNRGGTRYMPFAFIEHEDIILTSVLNSDKNAIAKISIGFK
ncbi:MAG: ORF6N domain-containing protein [Ferruginibacter sp.]|nr:ORF6N domain-containing protein [Ferruginibacter sp.]